jgi:hypothetical protein
MGVRGTKPQPTALKVLHDDRPDGINHEEPLPREDEVTRRPSCPTTPAPSGIGSRRS